MALDLNWSDQAEVDLRDLIMFVRAAESAAAQEFVATLLERVELLTELPELGRKIPQAPETGYREIIYRSYRIIDRAAIQANEIQVVRIWHGARGEPDLPH